MSHQYWNAPGVNDEVLIPRVVWAKLNRASAVHGRQHVHASVQRANGEVPTRRREDVSARAATPHAITAGSMKRPLVNYEVLSPRVCGPLEISSRSRVILGVPSQDRTLYRNECRL